MNWIGFVRKRYLLMTVIEHNKKNYFYLRYIRVSSCNILHLMSISQKDDDDDDDLFD
jgi:hypothetical protein